MGRRALQGWERKRNRKAVDNFALRPYNPDYEVTVDRPDGLTRKEDIMTERQLSGKNRLTQQINRSQIAPPVSDQ